MKKLLVTAPLDFDPGLEVLMSANYQLKYHKKLSRQETQEVLTDFNPDAWICDPCPTFIIDKDLIENAHNLKIIATPSTGKNHISYQLNDQSVIIKGLLDTNIVKEITASSEFTFTLILALIKNLRPALSYVADGLWRSQEHILRSREMSSLKLGIIGLGRIGSNVARYAKSMNMEVFFFDPYVESGFSSGVVKCNTIELLIRTSDVILVSAVLSDETRGLIDHKYLSMMQSKYLVNTSRGDIVDESSLCQLIREDHFAGVACDVLQNEHLLESQPSETVQLSTLNSRFLVTPHIAGLTIDSERKAQLAALSLCTDYLTSLT